MQRQTSEKTLNIRKAELKDIESIVTIEESNASNPWLMSTFNAELTNHLSNFFVAEYDDCICGFIIFWIIGTEAELHNISVAPEFKSQGIAIRLMEHMDSRVEPECETIFLEVRASNAPAIALYNKLGFINNGSRKNYYRNPTEDALLFSRNL